MLWTTKQYNIGYILEPGEHGSEKKIENAQDSVINECNFYKYPLFNYQLFSK